MRYLESNLPSNIHLRVYHLHNGNTPSRGIRGLIATAAGDIPAATPRYVTIAKLYDEDGSLLSKGVAACSPKDAPCRSTGRAIAVGRAMKAAGLSR